MLIDTHAHLNSPEFEEKELKDIIIRAKENNIERIINIGYDLESSVKAINIADKYNICKAAIGIHPSDVDKYESTPIEDLENIIVKDVLAIGEIGLDYYWTKDNIKKQQQFFADQIELALKYDLPIVVHSRDAIQDTYDILSIYKDRNLKGVLHCYSGSLEMARKFIELGFYISFAGPLTFKNAKVPKEVAKEIDLNKILIETDCPYLSPVPLRGKRNEPANIIHTFNYLCELLNIESKVLSKILKENTYNLFKER